MPQYLAIAALQKAKLAFGKMIFPETPMHFGHTCTIRLPSITLYPSVLAIHHTELVPGVGCTAVLFEFEPISIEREKLIEDAFKSDPSWCTSIITRVWADLPGHWWSYLQGKEGEGMQPYHRSFFGPAT